MFYLSISFSTIIHCEASVVVFLFILFLGTIFYFSIIVIRPSKKSTLQYYIQEREQHLITGLFESSSKAVFPFHYHQNQTAFLYSCLFEFYILAWLYVSSYIPLNQQTKNGLDLIVTVYFFFVLSFVDD